MKNKITQELIDSDRRGFIDKVVKGSIGGSLMLMIPMSSNLFAEVLSEDKNLKNSINPMNLKANYCFMVDVTSCIGCGSCCVADRKENDVPQGQYRTWVERYVIDMMNKVYVDAPDGGEKGYSNTPIHETIEEVKEAFFVPKLCNMCAEPSCTQVCPVAATFTTPDGFVVVDNEHCVSCGYCVQACPYGVRFINEQTKVADKCTWCYHRVRKGKLPACVNACPTGARKFGDLNDKESEVAKIYYSKTRLKVLKKDLGNEPQLYYIDLHEEVV
ncbi:MAG: 4Fe-4S dicluster domain-containing protein [Campylobacterota bacterium]|nr:4Fe-4S dicluster domain-containing protein [Campylobacterota bacterium]